MRGIRKDCKTGQESIVTLTVRVKVEKGGQTVFELIGGPTGFESFYLTDKVRISMLVNGWHACAGTKDRWDSLFIPAKEMRKAFELIGCNGKGPKEVA